MGKYFTTGLVILALLLVFTGGACTKTEPTAQEEPQKIAESFVKAETTFVFDGWAYSLKLTNTTATTDGWRFTYAYTSQHAGYGDRTGQVLAQVETDHTALITVAKGKVTAAVMDGAWDMLKQQMVHEMEIALAPIEEANATLLTSNPPQISIYIKGGLASGCTIFHDLTVTRDGSTINIEVTVQRPKDVSCPTVYTNFEKYVNLGTDFTSGTTYIVYVNDYKFEFSY
jgi:hypothetical protein